ncbi:MAG: cobyrinate a,c-diamide synthase [Chloroflexota bacterium]
MKVSQAVKAPNLQPGRTMRDIPRLIVAAPASGSGKSLIASGLMAAFARQTTVQGFKVGPDYIDPMYHSAATGRPSRNLDTWMLSPETVRQSFGRACQAADMAVIEGVMGLFDGYDSSPFNGSTAEVAHLLDAPVVLVMDCARMSGSAAATAHGFHTFVPEVRLAGVICNRVGGKRHTVWLRESIERLGLPVLGCLPYLPNLQVPERHLGLFTVAERPDAVRHFLAAAADAMQQHLDLPTLRAVAGAAAPFECGETLQEPAGPAVAVRIAVARDEAFCFYYEDNLDELRRAGATIVPFSPLQDGHLPLDISGIYLGGGYPELYAAQLSANHTLLDEIRAAHRRDAPIYAECGGLMYLAAGIHLPAGDFPLAGLLPGWCSMGTHLNMGYREVKTMRAGLLGAAGQTLRGHEFHYSQWENPIPIQAAYRISPRNYGDQPRLDGFTHGNLQAAYVHLHFGQNRALPESFVRACCNWQKIAREN